jgi:hypothetical protein
MLSPRLDEWLINNMGFNPDVLWAPQPTFSPIVISVSDDSVQVVPSINDQDEGVGSISSSRLANESVQVVPRAPRSVFSETSRFSGDTRWSNISPTYSSISEPTTSSTADKPYTMTVQATREGRNRILRLECVVEDTDDEEMPPAP